jgi:hypothetical protein
MIRRLCITGALVAALFATTFSTAHAATVSPSKWAPKFCNALEDWQTTIKDKGNEVQTSLSNATDLTAARDQLVGFLGDMESATQDAINAMKKAGTPKSTNGGKITGIFVKALQTAKADFATAKESASKLSTTDPTAFSTDGVQIGTDLQKAGDEIGNSFTGVDNLDKGQVLSSALQKAKACGFLFGKTSSSS